MIDHDLVFDALVLPQHLPVLRDFADLYPELRLVVDHGAKPPLRGGDLAEWRHDIARDRARRPMPSASSPAW